jgi:hypothetical protein
MWHTPGFYCLRDEPYQKGVVESVRPVLLGRFLYPHSQRHSPRRGPVRPAGFAREGRVRQVLVGRYDVLRRLGAGGMDAVWRVQDRALDEIADEVRGRTGSAI